MKKMRRFIIAALAFLPLGVFGQANTWEQPEEEEQQEVAKVNPDAKYLKGAVPEENGKVVFRTTIEANGKKASEVYDIVKKYMEKMTREKNQLNSRIAIDDSVKYELTGVYEEWLVFRSSAIVLDRTRLMYALQAFCYDNKAVITISRIHYLYDEGRNAQRYKAEEWITDKEAVNKKNTRLLPLSGKFRRKTIDRKDFLFNKFETLLK
jgi:colicin import membrane protein